MSTSEKRNKSNRVTVRATPEQLDMLRGRAAEVGLPISGYLLACGLSHATPSKSNSHLIEALRLLGVQQKELCNAHGGVLTPQYRAVLVEILAAIGRVGA